MCALTIQQVVGLVKTICKDNSVIDRLEKDLNKSAVFKALPKTPISAILLARILNENVQEIPSTMTDLYAKYMELVLGRWDMQKGLQSQIEYDVINNVVINIAIFSLENNVGEVPLGDVFAIYESYVSSRKFNIDTQLLYSRLLENKEVFYHNRVKGVLAFRHRTFAEYFYAQGMVRDNSAVIDMKTYELYWSSSYFFYFGLKRDCPQLIKALDSIESHDERFMFLKLLNHGQFLLAAYLTPYEDIARSLSKAFKDASFFHSDLVDLNIESPLQQLSKLQITMLTSRLLSMAYGYDFFLDAIKEEALNVYSTPCKSDEDMQLLFFLNTVLIFSDEVDAYDYMLKEYPNTIPLILQTAMLENTSDNKKLTLLLEKLSKKLYKSAKKNPSMQKALIDLYDKPLKG
ncbi:NACHT domain-containing protein [Vreelandella boliviensis]|uniref:NACHT domain-containing protein n=1 Tax=Vreelandella boliviensis TaxID=223527 RepID=UPI001B8B6D0E|nr:hypothetical protein [Halomonas boliviensis]MBS3667472.1 hypothetical protein [Halomonas boliviensis]